MRCQDMKDAINKKLPNKSFIPQGGKETRIPHNSWKRKDMKDDETRKELGRKNYSLATKIHGNHVINVWEKVSSITSR